MDHGLWREVGVVHLKLQFLVRGVSKIGSPPKGLTSRARFHILFEEVVISSSGPRESVDLDRLLSSQDRALGRIFKMKICVQPKQLRAVTADAHASGPPLLRGVATCQS